jgi:hypothetical protein
VRTTPIVAGILVLGAAACGARSALVVVERAWDASPDAPGCQVRDQDLRRFPAELTVLLDRSSSMRRPLPGSSATLWQELTAALDETVAGTEGLVRWGLKTFPTTSGCDVSDGVEVAVDTGDVGPLRAFLRMTGPSEIPGGTPAQAAIERVTQHLAARRSQKLQYLVLATDGAPSCVNGSQSGNAVGATEQALLDAAKVGLRTFVVGIAIADSREHEALNRMAVAGGEPRGGTTRYISAASRRELAAALGPIVSFVSCSLPLPPARPDASVIVVLDGEEVPESTTDGWSVNESRGAVTLSGSWCARVRERRVERLTLKVGCDEAP